MTTATTTVLCCTHMQARAHHDNGSSSTPSSPADNIAMRKPARARGRPQGAAAASNTAHNQQTRRRQTPLRRATGRGPRHHSAWTRLPPAQSTANGGTQESPCPCDGDGMVAGVAAAGRVHRHRPAAVHAARAAKRVQSAAGIAHTHHKPHARVCTRVSQACTMCSTITATRPPNHGATRAAERPPRPMHALLAHAWCTLRHVLSAHV